MQPSIENEQYDTMIIDKLSTWIIVANSEYGDEASYERVEYPSMRYGNRVIWYGDSVNYILTETIGSDDEMVSVWIDSDGNIINQPTCELNYQHMISQNINIMNDIDCEHFSNVEWL